MYEVFTFSHDQIEKNMSLRGHAHIAHLIWEWNNFGKPKQRVLQFR